MISHSKRLLLPLSLTCIVIALAYSVWLLKAGPRIQVPPEVKLGTLTPSDTISVTVPIANVGRGVLVIDKIDASCGCTSAKLESETIPAGRMTHMLVKFVAPQRLGEYTANLLLHTNDGNLAVPVLIRANIAREVSCSTEYLDVGTLDQGDLPARRELLLFWDRDKVDSKTIDIQPTSPFLDVHPVEAAADAGITIGVSANRRTPIGPISGAIAVRYRSGTDAEKTLTIPVVGRVRGCVASLPSSLILTSESQTASCRVVSSDGGIARIERLELSPEIGRSVDAHLPGDSDAQDGIHVRLKTPNDAKSRKAVSGYLLVEGSLDSERADQASQGTTRSLENGNKYLLRVPIFVY